MVITVPCARNGITAAAVNEIASAAGSCLKIDLLVLNEPDPAIREMVVREGGQIFILPKRHRRPAAYLSKLHRILKENRYDGIHVHGNSSTMALELIAAKRSGIPIRVSHCHNTRTSFPLVHRLLLPFLLSSANVYAACGREAGEWLYGKRPFAVLPNAVDLDHFKYSQADRLKCREELGIPMDKKVYLHVGTFNAQKNQTFLLDAFFRIAKQDPDAFLVLLGDGRELDANRAKAEGSGYGDRIRFCGSVPDPAPFYSAADCFLLPSLHEGLPFTAIEAQCSGLPCILSDSVTADADLTGLVRFLPLSSGADAWAEAAEALELDPKREEASQTASERISKAGYALRGEQNAFLSLYSKWMHPVRKLMIVTHKMTTGGCERVISILSDRFVSSGIETVLVSECRVPSAYPLPKDMRTEFLLDSERMRARDVPKAYLTLLKIAKREHPDLVLAMPEKVNVWTALFLLPLRIPVVVSERNDPRHHPESRIKRILRKMVYPFASGYIFQTDDARNYFSGRIRQKGSVLDNPLKLENFPEPFRGRRQNTVVSVGRLNSQKNYPLLIDAFSEFFKTHPEWKLIIFGEGTERNALEERIRLHGLEDRVSLPGNTANPAEKIRDAGMFVLSSDYEGMPNALIEAMAVGLPCISTDCPCGGPKTLINSDGNGILVPVGDQTAMTAAMTRIAENPDFADRLGRAAEGIRERMDADLVAEKWREYLDRVAR